MRTTVFRYSDGLKPNLIAFTYTLAAWGGGVLLLALAPLPLKLLGVLLTAHGLVMAAYFLHEFAHQSIFRTPEANARAGAVVSWMCGSCYASFHDLRRKHMRHHVDRADVVTFDYKAWLKRCPPIVRRIVMALEWAYVPAVEFIMHGFVICVPFIAEAKRHRRAAVITVLLIRGTAFALLGWLSPAGLLGYLAAYMIMLHVLRFGDAYQHTYDAIALLDGGPMSDGKVRDRAYEQRNTYSNVVSLDYPVLNLLMLNFPFHNAHHERPAEPWHRLPALHARLFPVEYQQVLPMATLLAAYHRYRVVRIRSDDYGDVPETADGHLDPSGFYGAVGVSFLTAV